MKKRYKIALSLLVGFHLVFAQNVEKNESIHNAYDYRNQKLIIDNSFGNIELIGWNKNTIEVDIEIITKANSVEKAQRLLDKIEIHQRESSNEISFKTDIDNINSRKNESFEINYEIRLPTSVFIEVEQKFGDVITDSREGFAEIDLSYGNLKALDFKEIDLKLSFGGGSMGNAEIGNLHISHSNFSVDQVKNLELEEKFSELSIGKVEDLNLKCNYGKVALDEVSTAVIDAQFTKLQIGTVESSIELKANYVSGFEINRLSKDFKRVDISSKFSALDIQTEQGLAANFQGEFSFATLKDYVGMEYSLKSKDNNDSEYVAKINGGDESRRIYIESSYGDLKIR